ncbi:MAG: hypothetical protein M3280_07135 [Actinomycetota bacterium]|nr:hypothetical protein [Actinomycetota bacterium]
MASRAHPENGGHNDERPRYGWFGPLLVSSWRLWKPNVRSLSVGFFIVIAILSLLFPAVVFFFRGSSVETSVVFSILLVTFLGVPFCGGVLTAYLGRQVRDRLAGRGTSFKDVRVALKPQRNHIFAAAMLATFLTLAFALVLRPVGSLVAPYFFLGPPILIHAIALEDCSFSEAWNRTKELMRGETVRVLVYLLCISLALGLIEILTLVLIAEAIRAGTSDLAANYGLVLLKSVIGALAFGLTACVGVSTYFELRARKDENFDPTLIEDEPGESEI